MPEELLINVNEFETRVALLEGGALQELHIARGGGYSYTGNIYLGRVGRPIPSMQAAFVDLGLERPGFLHSRSLGPRVADEGDETPAPDIRDLVHEGQEVLVQAIRDPISGKGLRLTTAVTLAAGHVVLTPFGKQVGISRRIEDDEERERLRQLIEDIQTDLRVDMGFIARTVSAGAPREVLAADIQQLTRIWQKIVAKQAAAQCPALIYEDIPLPLRVLRDLSGPRVQRILIDDEETYRRAANFAAEFLPDTSACIEAYAEPRPMFERFGIEDEAARALLPRVELKCGGFLVIEQTEAMTTIDVNTGSFLGVGRFEETVFRTNLEAASVIPRQLRLRNLGGIIVVDFIDMENPEHQRQVLRTLENAGKGDRARLDFEGFSSLGLVQMSRKRTRESLARQTCEPCPMCAGVGLTKTSETTCIEIFRAILRDAQAERRQSADEYLIRAPEAVVDRLLDEDASQLAAIANRVGQEIRLQVEPSYGPGEFDLVGMQGTSR